MITMHRGIALIENSSPNNSNKANSSQKRKVELDLQTTDRLDSTMLN